MNVSSVVGERLVGERPVVLGQRGILAAKVGVMSLTKSIVIQFGRNGGRCNAVAPGTVATEYWEHRKELDPLVFEKAAQWYPLGRVGRPGDIAESLMFLASDAASWITGIVLPVEGGLVCGNLAMAREIGPSQRVAGDHA
ncbi:MAG: SDR family oxidoreductase [Dermatophilaceae bacterium]